VTHRAADALAALAPDGGAAILAEAGIATWSDALASAPGDVVEGADGWTLLGRLRDFWVDQRDLQPAMAATRALLREAVTQVGAHHPDAAVELAVFGDLAMRAGRFREGASLVERAWRTALPALAPDDPRLVALAGPVAWAWVQAGRLDEAEEALSRALAACRRHRPDALGVVVAQLGEVRARRGRTAEAIPLLAEAHRWYATRFGADHPATVSRCRQLAAALQTEQRWVEAVPRWREAWENLTRAGDAEGCAAVAVELAVALEVLGERAEALRRLEESVGWTRGAGDPHPLLSARLSVLANAELKRGRVVVAEGLLREALDAERRVSGEASVPVAERLAALGGLLARTGRVDEALGWLDTAASLLRGQLGDADPRTGAVVDMLVALLIERAQAALDARDRELAAMALARAWALSGPVLGHVHARTRAVRDLRERHRLA